MCAIVVGMPCASRSVRASPHRRCAGRRSAARAVVGEAEPGVQVLLVGCGGTLDEQLAAHPEVQDQAERVAQVEPEVLPPPADGVDAAAGKPVGEVRRAGDVAAGDPVAAQLDLGDGAAAARARRGRGGRPRPRAAQARPATGPSGSSSSASPSGGAPPRGPRRALRAGRGWRSRPRRRPPARRPSSCGRRPCRARRRRRRPWPRTTWRARARPPRRAYSGAPQPVAGGDLLQARLPVQAGAERGRLGQQRVEQVVHELGGGVDARRLVDGADDRLDGVGEDRVLVAPAGRLLTAAEEDVVAQPEGAADVGEGPHVDDGGPQLRELRPRWCRGARRRGWS